MLLRELLADPKSWTYETFEDAARVPAYLRLQLQAT